MTASLGQFDQIPAFVTPPPARFLPHLKHGIKFPIRWTVLAKGVGGTFTDRASSCPAVATDDLEWMFWIDLVSFRDELAAGMIRTKDSGFPWCTKLQDTLYEKLLLFLRQDCLNDRTGY